MLSSVHNLPERLTSFIGRGREITDVKRALSDARLLTLPGTVGCGKTRLAIQVAKDLAGEFKDGVCFVALAPISDPNLVVSAVALALGIKEGGGQPLFDNIKGYLQDKNMLLLLDNFEQVLPAAIMVADLLVACPQLKIMVTSRAALRIYGEQELPVRPLELPSFRTIQSLPVEALAQNEAVALFLQRAQSVRSDLALSADNAPAIAEICVKLDGLPLAIELAAARTKFLTPQSMLGRLGTQVVSGREGRLTLLTGGAKDLPARQQTLRDTIAWSYDLLDEGEKALFRRLAVFVGGFSLEAVETVSDMGVGDQGSGIRDQRSVPPLIPLDIDLLDGLSSLVDKSLLRQDEQDGGEPYFAMLETIREYATERLEEGGEGDQARGAHACYFVELAETAEPELRGLEQVAWFTRLEREHDNLRAALKWSLENGRGDVALRMVGALSRFWFQRGYLTEGRKWVKSALDASAPEQGRAQRPAPTIERAKALSGMALLAYPQGEAAMSRALLEESLAMSKELGDKQGTAYTLNVLAIVVQQQEEYERGRALLEESLAIRRELGDRWGIAQSLNNLGDLVREQGDYEAARALYEECLETFRAFGSKDIASPLHNLAYVALYLADYRRAHALFCESLTYYREKGVKSGIAACLAGLAGVAGVARLPDRAARLFGASESLRESIGLVLEDPDLTDYERNLSVTRPQLDAAAFAAAWEQGKALTLDDAIVFALQDLPAKEQQQPVTVSSQAVPSVLSNRELEVLRLVAAGLSDIQVAAQLSLSRHTVHAHLTSPPSTAN